MSSQVIRLTAFKIPSKDHVTVAIKGFGDVLVAKQQKDGKPYILSLDAGPIDPDDVRAKGYTFGVKMIFASKEDMSYYENECEAHKSYKAYLKAQGVVFEGGPPLTLVFTPGVSASI